HGAMLVNIDPLTSKIAKNACRHIKVRPGSEGDVIKGIIKAIVESSIYDKGLESRPAYLDRIKAAVSRVDYKDIAGKSYAGEDEIRGVAELLAKGERVVIIAGPRLGYLAGGYNNALNLADLLVLTGLADRKGSGILPLALENNESGALMMGASPEFLPGYNDCKDKNIRSLFSKAWKEDISNDDGLTLMEMIEKAASGDLKALYLIGEDPVEDLPDKARIKEALGKVEFVIYQGIFPSEIMEQADLVLPASSFAEKDGYFTNLEGVVQRVSAAIDPRGESLPDWEIISLLSEKMGYPLSYGSSDEIHKEIDSILGSIKGDNNGLDHYMNSRHHGSESRWDSRPKAIDSGCPYALLFGETLFHSGRLSTFDVGLKGIYPGGELSIGPDDARRLGLADGDRVMVKSKNSGCDLGVKIDQRLPEGLLFFPWSFRNSSVLGLTDLQVDPDTKTPYFKMASVSIERI
ncbi:MAG: molybdopterin-dependent oxidoreductase, partial [Nitrospirota bacterium]